VTVTRHLLGIVIASSLITAVTGPASAQGLPSPLPGAQPTAAPPVQLQIVIARTRGDKKISSMPHVLTVKPDDVRNPWSRLRVGAQIPIPNAAPPAGATVTPSAFSFKEIGTSIDATANAQPDGRYQVNLSISETSVYGEGSEPQNLKGGAIPVLRSYQSTNSVFLRDGQTSQFTAGTDPLTGDIVRVDVTLTVPK
jgi:hypothetical protein